MLPSVCKVNFTFFLKLFVVKTTSDKVGRRLGCIQSASEYSNRPMSYYKEPRVPLFLRIIPRCGPKTGQCRLFFPVPTFSLHQIKTKFANLEDDFGLAGPTSGTSPHSTPLNIA